MITARLKMLLKIINYKDKDTVNLSLPLIIGEIASVGDSKLTVQNNNLNSDPVVWPVVGGKFKILVHLKRGENRIRLQHKTTIYNLILNYVPLEYQKFVRLVYIKCKDDEGAFQAPKEENNTIESACKRLSLAGRMLQTFTSDKLKEHDLKSKSFCMEEVNGNVPCHVFTSALSLVDVYKLSDEQLWSHFAVELMTSSLRVGNDCKFLAFLSFTRYKNNSNKPPRNHQEILHMTKGQVALGGGGLALFGSGCLHAWPENLQQVPWRFGDKRKIDRMNFMDDSANRGYYWACYSTGLGSTLHELGHTFDLGHTNGGIMGRGFDDIHKYFIVDMFYHDHLFQKEYNPFYQASAVHTHTIPLSVLSPVSWKPSFEASLQSLCVDSEEKFIESEEITNDSQRNLKLSITFDTSGSEKPWRIPNPPDAYSKEKLAVHVGGAYWTRSSALILYFHKWFNDLGSDSNNTISLDGAVLSSPNGIRVIEFRDAEGTSFHHLEFLEDGGKALVDLTSCNISGNIPDDVKEISFITEDSLGNVLKSKIDVKILLPKKM